MKWCDPNVVAVILALCLGLAPVGVVAQSGDPEGDVSLPPSAVALNLSRATVRIAVGPSREPGVRWWRQQPDDPGSAELLIARDGASVVIERPEQPEGSAKATLIVEISAALGTPVSVVGSDLDLTVASDPAEETESGDTDIKINPDARTTLELQLWQSQAFLSGTGQILGSFDGTHVEIRETAGEHNVTISDSALLIVKHKGLVTVAAQNSDFTSDHIMGRLTVNAVGGSVDLRSNQGQFRIETQNSQVQILNPNGGGSLIVTDSNVDLRGARLQVLGLRSTSSHTNISDCRGKVSATILGGSLATDNLEGEVTANAIKGAKLEFVDHIGAVNLNLQQNSVADLDSIQGEVTVTAVDADFKLNGAEALTLIATGTHATVSAINALKTFEATRSDVDLDLSQCRSRNLTVSIHDESIVHITLATPCRVGAKGASSNLGSQVEVSSCELRLGKSRGRWANKTTRGIDGQLPITLFVQIAASAELIVNGHP